MTTTNIRFNLDLLKYMDSTVRFERDITNQEYKVAGIDWGTGDILVLGIGWVHPANIEIVPSHGEELNDE